MSPLLAFLQRMGAQQLCLRMVAVMAMPPRCAVDVLSESFLGLADKVNRNDGRMTLVIDIVVEDENNVDPGFSHFIAHNESLGIRVLLHLFIVFG